MKNRHCALVVTRLQEIKVSCASDATSIGWSGPRRRILLSCASVVEWRRLICPRILITTFMSSNSTNRAPGMETIESVAFSPTSPIRSIHSEYVVARLNKFIPLSHCFCSFKLTMFHKHRILAPPSIRLWSTLLSTTLFEFLFANHSSQNKITHTQKAIRFWFECVEIK